MGRLDWTPKMRAAARERRLGRPMPTITFENFPADFNLHGRIAHDASYTLGIRATCSTAQELDAVIHALRHMRQTLPDGEPVPVTQRAEKLS